MKKILLSAALVAVCSAVSAQKFTYVPYTENALMEGTTISSNGKYVGGCDTEGRAFIHNTQTKETKYFYSPDLEEGGEGLDASVNSITDDGVGVGYLATNAVKFDFASGTYSQLLDESSIANYVSPDGKFVTGFTYDAAYTRTPFYMADGVKKALPTATSEWLGYEVNGFSVTSASADGSLIIGGVMDNFASFPMVAWSRNADNDTYSILPLSRRFFDGSMNLDGPQPYDWVEAAAISADGKWIAVNLHDKTGGGMIIGRYSVEKDSVYAISCPEATNTKWYYANGISNDGTVVGYLEDQRTGARYGIMCKAGENEAKYMADVYPTLTEIAQMDMLEFNTPCSITADGRYIEGFGYTDYDEESVCYATWYIDTQASPETGISSVENKPASDKVVASYSLDGKKLNRIEGYRGVVINKLADGRVRKTIK